MGNQQASFYYGLNYEENNDSGYFDDEEAASRSAALAADLVEHEREEPVTKVNKPIVKSKSIEIGTGASGTVRRRKPRTLTDNDELNDIDENHAMCDVVAASSVFAADDDSCACSNCSNRRRITPPVYSSSWSPTTLVNNNNNAANRRLKSSLSSIEGGVRRDKDLEEEGGGGEEEVGGETNEQVRRRRGESTSVEVVVAKRKDETASLSSSFSSYSLSLRKGMNYLGSFTRGVKDFYYEINPATLTGAIDVVVVQQEDGSFKCSPFHVRFGKLALIKTKDLTVDIEINGQPVDLHMKLGEAGEAYFIEELSLSDNDSSSCESLVNSPSGRGSTTTLTSSCKQTSTGVAQQNSSEMLPKSNENANATVGETLSSSSLSLTRTQSERHLKKSSTSTIPISESMEKHLSNQMSKHAAGGAEKMPKMMNFFSDGEITPELTSPVVSRPPTPKSDTEVETKTKRDSIHVSNDPSSQWSWSWGKLPERQNSLAPGQPVTTNTTVGETEKSSNTSSIKNKETSSSSSRILGGMFNLRGAHNDRNKSEEIYLDETEKLDSEVAALYLNQKSNRTTTTTTMATKPPQIQLPKDDDQESGNGQSLPQSPRDTYSILGDIQISLCGLIPVNQTTPAPPPTSASSSATNISMSSSSAVSTPQLIPTASQLNQLYSSSPVESTSPLSTSPPGGLASPATTSSLLIISPQSPAASASSFGDSGENFQVNFEELFQQYAVSFEKFVENIGTITSDPNLVIKINNRYMNWATASPFILAALVYQKPLPNEIANNILESNMPRTAVPASGSTSNNTKQTASGQQQAQQQSRSGLKNFLFSWSKKTSQSGEEMVTSSNKTVTTAKAPTTSDSKPLVESKLSSNDYGGVALSMDEDLLANDPSATMKYDEVNQSSVFMDETKLVAPIGSAELNEGLIMNDSSKCVSLNDRTYKKTTRLSSELIQKLNLQLGANEIMYSVTTALQGTTRIHSYIFLWNYDDKVIVSDIDGTITKSDVWGQVLPIFGRDWTQAGVADLYSAIEKNQYKFMYLSARAIGQSRITRDLLKNINQGGFTLPKGPLLVTPTSLFKAFQKEVIEKKPEEFKISCLKDIQLLFPNQHNPFFAGYGNKTSDVTAYKAVGIPVSRIFVVNPQGELKHEVSRTFQSSYSKLCDFVDLIFPPLRPSAAIIKADYDSFNFWRYNNVSESILNEIEQEVKKAAVVATTSPKDSKETLKAKQRQKPNK